MTTSASASHAHLFTRALLAAAICGTAFLTACGGGSDAATATVASSDTAQGISSTGATPTKGAASAAQSVSTDTTTVAPAGAAVLSWKAVTGASSYRVYYGTSSRAYAQALGAGVSTTTTSMTVSGLTSGTTYYFSVTAIDSTGKETPYSDEMTKLVS